MTPEAWNETEARTLAQPPLDRRLILPSGRPDTAGRAVSDDAVLLAARLA